MRYNINVMDSGRIMMKCLDTGDVEYSSNIKDLLVFIEKHEQSKKEGEDE